MPPPSFCSPRYFFHHDTQHLCDYFVIPLEAGDVDDEESPPPPFPPLSTLDHMGCAGSLTLHQPLCHVVAAVVPMAAEADFVDAAFVWIPIESYLPFLMIMMMTMQVYSMKRDVRVSSETRAPCPLRAERDTLRVT